MFIFIKSDPALRCAVGTFLVARVALSLWAFAVMQLMPPVVSNLDLFGDKFVAAFDARTGARAVFSRVLGERELHFRAALPNMTDVETASVWDMNGRAISGALAGSQLAASPRTVEEIFPYHGVVVETNPLLSPWQRFDANWYLKIAQHGYSAQDGSTVYFPLYPFLIRVLSPFVLGNDLFAGILISNLALIGVFYFLFRMVQDIFEVAAKRAVVYLALFPTAFFLLAPYTESLFLSLVLASLYAGRKSNWGRASIFGALAALTRLQGVLLLAPLAFLWWKSKPKTWVAAATLMIPLASCLFLFWQFTLSGNDSLIATYQSQLHARFVLPWDNVAAAASLLGNGRVSIADTLNLIVTFVFGAMVVLVWIKLPREFGLYSLAMYVAPLFRMTTEQPLVSMSRYALVIFPVFILLGDWGSRNWVNRVVVYLSFPLQLYLSAQVFLWGWVA